MKTPKEFLLNFNPSLKNKDIEKMDDFSGEFLLFMMGKYSEYLLEKKKVCDVISICDYGHKYLDGKDNIFELFCCIKKPLKDLK